MAKPPPPADRQPSSLSMSARAPPAHVPREAATPIRAKAKLSLDQLVAAADSFAERRALELAATTRAERRCDPGPHEQRSHQRGPENHVRNEHLTAHTPR